MGVKANQKFIDIPEFDEFFRRGDEPIHGADTLQPVAETLTDDESDSRVVRTPAQVERRARFIRLVSVMMAFLSVGSASAFTYKAVQSRRTTSNIAMHVTPPSAPVALAHDGPAASAIAQVQLPESQVVVEGHQPHSDLPAKTAGVPVQLAQADELAASLSVRAKPVQNAAPIPPERDKPVAPTDAKSTPEPKSALAAKPSADGARGSARPAPLKPVVATITAAKTAVAKPAVAKPAVAKPAAAKPAAAKPAVAKNAGPKPSDYRPPTVSFSD